MDNFPKYGTEKPCRRCQLAFSIFLYRSNAST